MRFLPRLTVSAIAWWFCGAQGRDASRNMQRAIKAGKLRERLGGMMEGLQAALAEWEAEEGGPFLYDEQVLQVRGDGEAAAWGSWGWVRGCVGVRVDEPEERAGLVKGLREGTGVDE